MAYHQVENHDCVVFTSARGAYRSEAGGRGESHEMDRYYDNFRALAGRAHRLALWRTKKP